MGSPVRARNCRNERVTSDSLSRKPLFGKLDRIRLVIWVDDMWASRYNSESARVSQPPTCLNYGRRPSHHGPFTHQGQSRTFTPTLRIRREKSGNISRGLDEEQCGRRRTTRTG